MTRLAIVDPRTLLGEAVREAIGTQQGEWTQIDLLTNETDGAGGVTEIGDQAALIQSLDPSQLADAEVALFCGAQPEQVLLEALPPSLRVVLVAPTDGSLDTVPVVAGVNLEQARHSNRLACPSPGVLMLAHLLAGLDDCGEVTVTAHILQPASARDQPGLDELFEQTRAILSMSEERPDAIFGSQLAFNLLPWIGSQDAAVRELTAISGEGLTAQIHTSQAGVFHCCSVGFYLDLERDPGLEEVRSRLHQDPLVEVYEDPEALGPVSAAASERIMLGPVIRSPTRGYWIWAVMDNLTCTANNALAIARP